MLYFSLNYKSSLFYMMTGHKAPQKPLKSLENNDLVKATSPQ